MERKRGQEGENQLPRRIIFEYQDGTVDYLEGDQAEKWSNVINGLITLGLVHGRRGQKELGSLQWREATSLKDIPSTEKAS